jgi:hypothetical protein
MLVKMGAKVAMLPRYKLAFCFIHILKNYVLNDYVSFLYVLTSPLQWGFVVKSTALLLLISNGLVNAVLF